MPNALIAAIGQHSDAERHAARTYEQLAIWCDSLGWDGSKDFFAGEAKEEREHVAAFIQFASMRNETVFVGPQDGFGLQDLPKSLADCYLKALALEQAVMVLLQQLATRAADENDWDAVHFLAPYLEIGRKSIYDLTTWKAQLARLAMDQAGLYAFDLERGK